MKSENPIHRLDRKKTRLYHGVDDGANFVARSPAECLEMVWELTKELWSLQEGFDAEQRLQRDVAVLIRKQL